MGWTIPPLGKCAVCLSVYANEEDAHNAWTMFKGTSLCVAHLRMLVDPADAWNLKTEKQLADEDAMFKHLRDDHRHVVYIGDVFDVHREDFPSCTWST